MVPPVVLLGHLKDCPHYFYPNVDWEVIETEVKQYLTVTNSRKVKYYEVPIAFDIEVTSTKVYGEKMAFMYHWQLSIQGYVILGRTWDEFMEVYNKLITMFDLYENMRIIIYIQNLAYEFQFMCKRFEWKSVFCLKERKPLKAVTTDWVEFRCSYALSGYNLETIGKNLQRYKIEKLVGDLDYDLVRHHKSLVTETELAYCINDVQVVVAYIQETAENDGGYNKIPLTKTGYVRNYCREECMKAKNYRKLMSYLTITHKEYLQLKRAFAGGFTHASWHYSGRTMVDMDSFDFTSSYPSVMVAEKFPMSASREVTPKTVEEFENYLKRYCCLFDIEIKNIDGWEAPDHILSYSKCRNVVNPTLDNGRIITADTLVTTITDVDYNSLLKFYKWDEYRVFNMRIYDRGYLPTSFVRAILTMYRDKTELKDIEGKEVEYMKAKGNINSAYGMTVTDIIRNEDTYEDGWISKKPDGEAEIISHNRSKKRFLFYPWGVWVTAYARANLFDGILEFGDDYVYSDTDSIKAKNTSKHMDYINTYNKQVTEKLRKACAYHKIDFAMTRPKTKKGVEKPLGIWDFDGHYRLFKTLGAKRYMTDKLNDSGEYDLGITVAGLGKITALKYIKSLAEKKQISPFDLFNDDLYIPPGKTGKNIHSYIDYTMRAEITDYNGVTATVEELSAVHMEAADYSLSLEEGYLRLLRGQRYKEI